MRVLVFNGAADTRSSLKGVSWTEVASFQWNSQIWAPNGFRIVDHDVIIVDAKALSATHQAGHEIVTPRIAERIRAGGCLICFVGQLPLSWLPGVASQGEAVTSKPLLGSVIKRLGSDQTHHLLWGALQSDPDFEVEIALSPNVSQGALVLARSGTDSAVAAIYNVGSGRVILLPPMFKTRQRVVRLLLERVVPELLPTLASARPIAIDQTPNWLAQFDVPGAVEGRNLLGSLENEAQDLESQIAIARSHLDRLLEIRGLLWRDGDPLRDLVGRCLTDLGIEASPREPVDLIHKLESGAMLFIEVEGTKGAVGADKGAQLLRYKADAEAEELGEGRPLPTILSAIVGNPWRQLPPGERPGKGQVNFAKELTDHDRKRWTLATTCDLFSVACQHLKGDATAPAEARRLLGIPTP
jgi:hypothetical protein